MSKIQRTHAPEAPNGDFIERLRGEGLAPLWDVLHDLVTPEPASPVKPARWRYNVARKLVLESGDFISAERAERRVLILENPGLVGQSSVTRSLYAGLQLVLPGEIARAHRHTQTALRFVIEGDGGYTVVDDERLSMAPGDLVLTPAWTFHDHGNDGASPMIWLDGLDVQLVNLLDTSFAEPGNAQRQNAVRQDDGVTFAGHVSLDPSRPRTRRFPFAHMRQALVEVAARGLDPYHGVRLRYCEPQTGDWPLATMGPFAQFIPAGFHTRAYRATDASVFLVHEGRGRVRIGAESYDIAPKDIFVAPSWQDRVVEADKDLVLLAFSDRPAQEKLGLWREQRAVNSEDKT